MADNAIYCKNNILIRQFDYGNIHAKQFSEMLEEAISDVPGLVGMSHIYNNTGIAYMMSAKPDEALNLLDKGLEYANSTDRQVQYFAMLCNKLITKSYYGEHIEFSDIKHIFIQIFDGMVRNDQLPFISARYIMNLLVIAIKENRDWGRELLQQYDIIRLFNSGLSSNTLGNGQLLKQLNYLEKSCPNAISEVNANYPLKLLRLQGGERNSLKKRG